MKKIIIILLIFGAIVVYVRYSFSQKADYLRNVAIPFNEACQTQTGCILSPEGWDNDNGTFHKDMMEYSSTKEEFKIYYHIATDSWLMATGGKGREVKIENAGEHR